MSSGLYQILDHDLVVVDGVGQRAVDHVEGEVFVQLLPQGHVGLRQAHLLGHQHGGEMVEAYNLGSQVPNEEFLRKALPLLDRHKVELRCDESALAILGDRAVPAEDSDWDSEYDDYILAVRAVSSSK